MTDAQLVARAADFACRAHSKQRRKGAAQEPYVNHLAEVAAILADAAPDDAELIAAGWLHDTIEDTSVTREDLQQAFGEAITALVLEVTDDKCIDKAKRKRLQVENEPKKSLKAKQIKIADKTSNLRSLMQSPPDRWERERLLDYLDWASRVVAGCRGVSRKLDALFDDTLTQARRIV